MDKMPLVTVFTATFNRAASLGTVYQSLARQTFRDFEWVIVDDGSTDDTGTLVSGWIGQAAFPIRYFYQENNGKHIAMNKALDVAKGYFFANLDSDDYIADHALETMVNAWNGIPRAQWADFAAVKARCFDPDTGMPIGRPIPNGKMVTTIPDARYKQKINFEMWSMSRTEVRRKYRNPEIYGGRERGVRFYPEGIWQDLASREYKVLLIDAPLRAYTRNTSTSLMGYGASYDRSRENIHLWVHVVNHNLRYFLYDPWNIGKAIVGVSMDGLLLRKSVREILAMVNSPVGRLLVFLAFPVGYVCYRKRR